MRLYLVRHGESSGNKENRFRGRTDFPLTDNGRKQAEEVANYLLSKDVKIEKIFSSPLVRALETAQIIGKTLKVNVEIDESFNNIKLGPWEGKKKDYIKENYPKEWDIWVNNPELLKLEGMETIDDIRKRTVERVSELIDLYEDKDICVVTHRAVIKPLIAGLIDIKSPYFWRIHIDNASLSYLEYNKNRGWMLIQLNVNHYLSSYLIEKV